MAKKLPAEIEGLIVVIYVRVSTERQGKGVSLDVQEGACRKVISEKGLTGYPVHVWVEMETGSYDERPELEEIRQLIARGKVKAVAAYDTDRLARDSIQTVMFSRLCMEHGTQLIFGDGTTVETKFDEVIQFLKGFNADVERTRIRDRMMDAKEELARSGIYPVGMGSGMYGYDPKPDGERGLVINEQEAAVVRLIVTTRLEGKAVHGIALMLNEQGIPTKRGKKWDSRQVNAILRRKAYTGVYEFGKARHVKISKNKRVSTPKPESEWIIIDKWFPKIIEPSQYEGVQALWNRPRAGSRKDQRVYPLSGVMECGMCGSSMGGHGQKRRWFYYRCSGRYDSPKRPRFCGRGDIPALKTESAVMGSFTEVVKNPTGVIEEVREHLSTGGGDLGEEMKRLAREIGKCEAEVRSYAQQLARGTIDEKIFDDLVGPVNVLLGQRREELGALEAQQELRDEDAEMEEKIRGCFAEYEDVIDGMDAEGWRAMLDRFGVKVVVGEKELLVMATLDPGLFTIGHTLASTTDWSFTVPVKPAPVDWGPKKRGRSRK